MIFRLPLAHSREYRGAHSLPAMKATKAACLIPANWLKAHSGPPQFVWLLIA